MNEETNENIIAGNLLKDTNLTLCDATRLILEAIEKLEVSTHKIPREKLIGMLRDMIQKGVFAVKATTHTVTLETAIWSSIEARENLRPTSKRDLRHFARRILRVRGAAELPLRVITSAQCKKILSEAFGTSQSSYAKGRVILHSVFSFGIRQEWCDSNPVIRIKAPKIKEKIITPLSPSEVENLKKTASRPEFSDMKFSLNLMLYAGIRPTEVSRLRETDFYWDEQTVIIRSHVSKTGGGRSVSLEGLDHIKKSERYIPKNWKRKWHALRRAAGYRNSWIPDICRHTFASYHAAYFRNLPALQLEMGHRDVSLLMSRYVMPTLKKDAITFWNRSLQQPTT